MRFSPSRSPLNNTLPITLLIASSVALIGSSSAQLSTPVDMTTQPVEMEAVTPQLETDPTIKQPVQARAVVVDIVSDTLDYEDATGLYVATGDVKVLVSEQNTELTANKVTYDPEQELVVAEGDVVISDGPEKVYGTYAKIDLTRESALINDPITVLDQVRVKAREGFKDGKFTRLMDGKLILPPPTQVASKQSDNFGDNLNLDLSELAVANPFRESATTPEENTSALNSNNPNQYGNSKVLEELDMRWDEPSKRTGFMSKLKFHAKEVDVVRHGNYDDINLKSPSLRYRNLTLGRLPQADFARTTEWEDIEYLGPDIGVDPDNGGFYAGPGFDFNVGDSGFVKFSPYLSYGTGRRQARRGQDVESVSGFGAGALLNYMSHKTNATAGYNVAVGTPTAIIRRKIGDGSTTLMAAANEDYTNGLFGWERPTYVGQVVDKRAFFQEAPVNVRTFASAGVAHDNFFPTLDDDFFVEQPNSEPITAGRVQLQAQFATTNPLLSIGDERNSAKLGLVGQVGLSGYSTGDYYSVFRGGPQLRVKLFDRFTSQTQYFNAYDFGDSPFVFDTYYGGRNNVLTTNQIKINKYISVGMQSNISVNSDNARGDMLLGNQLFMLVGPDDVKFNIAYDVIRQRSFFGISFLPGKDRKTLFYDRMNIQDEIDYQGPPPLTPAIPAAAQGTAMDMAGNVRDVGMMNGNRAQ